MEEYIKKTFALLKQKPLNLQYCMDLLTLFIDYEKEDPKKTHEYSRVLRNHVIAAMAKSKKTAQWFQMYKRLLLFDAKWDFDSYMIYMEIDRKPEERFYQPRRRVLKQAVDAMQALADDELDELFISQPPRTGKTTLLTFYATWLMGRKPHNANLYSAYSDIITTAFFSGVLEIMTDPMTYHWEEVFNQPIKNKNAQLELVDVERRKRYPSLTCRSLYGTLNGACDCSGILMSDDLIGGIEEAMNKDRLIAAWSKVDNNLIPRAKESAKILWVGTRWSIADPAGIRMSLLEEDERFKDRRYKIINLPALNENDESNFDYDYGVGFSTEFYHQRRASFEHNNDMASWAAQYMGMPIEREGTLFTPDGFRYYNGELPDGEPDRKFMAVDPAFGGGDFVAAPIAYQYGDDIYIVDVIYSNEEKNITQPMIAEKAFKNGLNALQIEANKMTLAYKEGVETLLKAKNYRLNMTSKPAPPTTSKEQRIFDKAPDIRERCIFLEPGKRSREYDMFMQNVFTFKIAGKNKHDDAPDSLAMLMDMAMHTNSAYAIFRRPF